MKLTKEELRALLDKNYHVKTSELIKRLAGSTQIHENEKTKVTSVKDGKATLSFASSHKALMWYGYERLEMSDEAMDASRVVAGKCSLIFNHDKHKLLGRVLKVWIEDDTAYAEVEFGTSARAQEMYKEVEAGIISSVSFGYRFSRDDMHLEQVGQDDDPNVYLIKRWMIFEISIEVIPEDSGVGIRSIERTNQLNDINQLIEEIKNEDQQNSQRSSTMTPEEIKAAIAKAAKDAAAEAKRSFDDQLAVRNLEVEKIFEIAHKHDSVDLARSAIKDGKTAGEFAQIILEKRDNKPNESQNDPDTSGELGLDENEKRSFSVSRMIRAGMTRNWDGAGLEEEIVKELCQKRGKPFDHNHLFIPTDIVHNRSIESQRTGMDGSALIATRKGSLIELLQAKTFSNRLGVQFMTGLTDNFSWPKQTADVQHNWLAKDEEADPINAAADDDVFMSPKVTGGASNLDKSLMINTSEAVDLKILSWLATKGAQSLDWAMLYGDGKALQPLGIFKNREIKEHPLGASARPVGWTDLTRMATLVSSQDYEAGNTYYLMNSKVEGALKETPKYKDKSGYIWEETTNMINGATPFVSNLVSSTGGKDKNLSDLVYGDFRSIMVGMWGPIEIVINPNRHDRKIRIAHYMSTDIGYEFPEGLSKISGIKTDF